MANLELLLEAEKRGLLPPEKQMLLSEARSRGIVPGGEPAAVSHAPTSSPNEGGFFKEVIKRTLPGRIASGNILYPDEESFIRKTLQGAASGPASGIVQKIAQAIGNTEVSDKIAQTAKEGNWVGGLLQPEGWLTGGKAAEFIGKGRNAITQALRSGATVAPITALSASEAPSDSAVSDMAKQGAIGGVVGAALPMALRTATTLAKPAYNIIEPYLGASGANNAAARLAGKVSNGEGQRDEITNLLINAKSGQTAADAALPAKNAEFSALQELVGQTRPSLKRAVESGKDEAARTEIANIAGTPELMQRVIERRASRTEPMRKAAMDAADTSHLGFTAQKAAEQRNNEMADMVRNVSEHTMPPSKIENFASNPLDIGSIQTSIATRMKQPGEGIGIDAKVLEGVGNEIKRIQALKGRVYPEDLHEIRKKGINDVIESLNTGTPGSTDKRAAQVAADVKKTIDSVLDEASGGVWTPYLSSFQRLSRLKNAMETGKGLQDALTGRFGNERIAPFGTALRSAENKVLPESGSTAMDALYPRQRSAVERVADQFEKERQIGELAKSGSPEALRVMRATELPGTAPGMISWKITALNKVLNALEGTGGVKTNKALAELMLKDPQTLGRLMANKAKPSVDPAVQAIMERQAAISASQGR